MYTLLVVAAMMSGSESLQALGYEKARLAFPEADEFRLRAKSTHGVTDDLERFNKLFPTDRYGKDRNSPLIDDPDTYFRDLDPMIAIRVREEPSQTSTSSTLTRGGPDGVKIESVGGAFTEADLPPSRRGSFRPSPGSSRNASPRNSRSGR